MTTPSEQSYPTDGTPLKTKICNRKACKFNLLPQPISNFCHNKRERDGYHGTCKNCIKECAEKRKHINIERFANDLIYKEGETKICSRDTCKYNGISQPTTNFYRHIVGGDGLNTECKNCSDKYAKQYREKYPERIKRCLKEWNIKNKDKIRVISREHYIERRKERIADWIGTKLSEIKKRSERNHIPFNIDADDLSPLPTFCSVFGIKLDYLSGPDRRSWASVDRIKPALGYVKGNIRIISLAANMAKFDGIGDIFSIKQIQL